MTDVGLLTSRDARFVADVELPDMLHAAVARSWAAHARINRVDAVAARAIPGVEVVLTAADLPSAVPGIAVRMREKGTRQYLQPILARDRVRYVGEPVAIVLARSRREAEDGAEAVVLDLERLPVVTSALAASPEPLFGDADNVAAEVEVAVGDVAAALAMAAVVVERRFRIARQGAMPLETRGVVAAWRDGRLELWGLTKLPHHVRGVMAAMLGLAEASVRVHEVRAGGGFGVRGELYPEDILVALATMATGRPVKWIEDRREHMIATNQSREQEWTARIGLDRDGHLVGLDASLVNDMGAYLRTHGTVVPRLSATELGGPYRIPNYRCRLRAVMTNKTPTGTTRSPGRYEATFVRERLLDIAARELGLDVVELRRRNLVPPEAMPFDTGIHLEGLDVVLDSGDYKKALDLAVSRGRERHADLLATIRDGRRLGFGVVVYSEATGHGPRETAAVTLRASGEIEVMTGAPSLGQGHETVFAEVAAAALGWAPERVHVVPLDTDALPTGGGTWASRGATVAAGSVDAAAAALRLELIELATEHLGSPSSEVSIGPGGAAARGRELGLEELLRLAGRPEGLRVERSVKATAPSFSYGSTATTVAVDLDTGKVEVLAMTVVAGVGKILNREVVRGQLQGAAVQGIGGTLLERFTYSEDGQPLATTFVDYLLPSTADVPAVEVHVLENHPSPFTPLGAKGAGELGILGPGASIANAIVDALQNSGAEFNELPIVPEAVARAAGGDQLT